MLRLAALFGSLAVAACGVSVPAPAAPDVPKRIVSLDYCADQYVLKFAERAHILAVSPDAGSAFSYMRDTAADLKTVRPRAEDVILLKPDLVVRAYGGGPNAARAFEAAGIPVLSVGHAADLNGIAQVTQDMANGLGAAEMGAAVVAEFEARLGALNTSGDGRSALYMTPSGVTSGPGSLVHDMLEAAGLTNFQDAAGWHALPLERLAYAQPDLVAAAFFESHNRYTDGWSAMRHPVVQRQLGDRPVVKLEGAWTSCGAWFLMDAIEALAEGAGDGA